MNLDIKLYKKVIQYILLLIPIFSMAQHDLIGDYKFKLTFNNSSNFVGFKLKLLTDSTFTMSQYVYHSCYSYNDTLEGKWKVVNNNLSFFDIDQPKYISKYYVSNLKDNEILIKEQCVYSEYMYTDSARIKLLALDSNYKPLNYLNPERYNYGNETLITTYKLPPDTYQIIYFNANYKPISKYNYGGITIVGFKDNNTFEISNCGMIRDMPLQFLNPLHQFKIEKDGSLKSLKKFKEIEGKSKYRIFKKYVPDNEIN